MAAATNPPWKRSNPKASGTTHHLTSSETASAKRSAKKSGGLIRIWFDNVRAVAKGKNK